MNFESFGTPARKTTHEAEKLAIGFRELVSHPEENGVFKNFESDLTEKNFVLAEQNDVFEVFNDTELLCRSESFSRVMELVLDETPLAIKNKNNEANMCTIATGSGFKVAMQEGFSGKDVGSALKTVITFSSKHIETREQLAPTNRLWEMKPETAQVSLSGSGTIFPEDIRMISFRFPVRLYPSELLTETEMEQLEDNRIQFIVRHYIPNHKKTTH